MFTYTTYVRSFLSMDCRPQLLSTAMSPVTWPPTAAVSFSMVHTATDYFVRSSRFSSTIQVQLKSDPYCCYLDLYSRGYSVGPAVDHDPVFYVTQLHELLKHVGWTRCNFVGLSLGGGIVAAYAHRFPEAVLSLNFVAPAGLLSVSSLHDRSMPMNQNKGKTYFPRLLIRMRLLDSNSQRRSPGSAKSFCCRTVKRSFPTSPSRATSPARMSRPCAQNSRTPRRSRLASTRQARS